MKFRRFSRFTFRRTPLAAALLTSFAAPLIVHAADDAPATEVPGITVQGQRDLGVGAEAVSSPKFVKPLVDTPQTITVIKKEVIAEQGARSLTEALRNTPGITFQLGENGNTQSGDTIFLRGFDTQNSIFLDNVRDLGSAVRDVFNLEQVEIFKGPAGADNGRGATSGYVNLASKLPQADDFTAGTLAYGMEEQRRITADLNQRVGESSALRLNLLAQDGGVPGRDFVERSSWGVAPSVAFGLGTGTRIYAFSQHIRQDNTPDGAVSAIGVADYLLPRPSGAPDGPALPTRRVDEENFYGLDSDFENLTAHLFTVRIEHDLSPNLTVRNLSRYGRAKQERILTSPQAPIVSDSMSVPDDPATPEVEPPIVTVREDTDTWTVARSRHASFRDNDILTNQTHFTARFKTGSIAHALTSGGEFLYEKQFNPTYALATGTTQAPGNLYNPNRADPATPLIRNVAFTDGNTVTAGLYLFDTMDLTERWQVNGGVRFERYRTETRSVALTTAVTPATSTRPELPIGTLLPVELDESDNLTSWKVGALFKPLPNGSVYVAYANSLRPPGSDSFALNAGTPSSTNGSINNNRPNLDPQEATNIEIGTKWQLLDKRVFATVALFKSENKNDLARNDPGDPERVIQYGEREVEGIELGISGQLTKAWQITAGLTHQETDVTEGQFNTVTNLDTQSGSDINFSPKLSATLWTTYDLPFGLSVGGGARYVDSQSRTVNNDPRTNVTTGVFQIPDYTVIDAFAAYALTPKIGLQLNAYNLTDEFYVAAINNSGQRYFAGPQTAWMLSANLRF